MKMKEMIEGMEWAKPSPAKFKIAVGMHGRETRNFTAKDFEATMRSGLSELSKMVRM